MARLRKIAVHANGFSASGPGVPNAMIDQVLRLAGTPHEWDDPRLPDNA
ncbi:hypothetical protein [Streptomyces sp. NBC_01518]